MIILGINDGHDAGACLMRDGKIVCVSSEERRVNTKNFSGVPRQSLQAVLQYDNIRAEDVQLITLASRIRTIFPTQNPRPVHRVLNLLASIGRTQWGTRFGRWLLPKLRKRKELLETLREIGLGHAEVMSMDHHRCHAATAYFHRPYPESPATILTLDGAGDGLCATVSVGCGSEMEVLSMTPKYHSPAAGLYSAITAYLGLKPYEHEYKVMGMSPYGQSKYCIDILRPSFSVQGLEFRNHTGHFGLNLARYFHRRLYRQRFDNVCAATQELFEELMVTWVKNAIQVTGVPHVCAAGGAFLNVKANQKIRELPEVQSLSVYPASDDGGTPVGAAILGTLTWAQRHNQPALLDLPRTMHLGLKFTETQIEQAILRAGLPLQRMSHPARDQAAILAQGLILARFQGREELGPRALGNRSIVADPRDLKMIRKLNFAIKQRDFWMPFAASILEEDMPRYIQGTSPAPYYMIESFPTTPLGFHDLIAGIHPFDRTIRPQVVNDIYPEYREMIQEFKMITGVGGVLNTSFNLHGFPIVGTPDIAIETYQRSAIDALAIGPFLLRKPAMEQA